jgi:predicted nuclease with TOPRIM domain
MNGFALRHLAFTGPTKPEAALLPFTEGLNVLYGASNTGKSFALKAIDFMLGSSRPLPAIEQRSDYDAVWLGLVLPDGSEATLYRAASGGAYRLFRGLVTSFPIGEPGELLQPQHDPKHPDNLSRRFLSLLALDEKLVVKNKNGEKESLSIRDLAPYMLVSEEAILAERSPILSGGQIIFQTSEKNVFKLLLTGQDDAAVVASIGAKTLKLARDAKVEMIDELIAGIDQEIGDTPPPLELQEQLTRLEHSLAALHTELSAAQGQLDELVSERRIKKDSINDLGTRLTELELMLERFERLSNVYRSDTARLEGLEEGSSLLLAIAGKDCTVCGAPPEAQRLTHGTNEIDRSYRAASAEVSKIERERQDLETTSLSLSAEAEGLRRRMTTLVTELETLDQTLENLRPSEARFRRSYEALLQTRASVNRLISLHTQRSDLDSRRQEYASKSKRGKKGQKLTVGIDGLTAFAFAESVQEVLAAWKFPKADDVQFDTKTQDLTIAGKERAANGKGVRALLHAAIKVATLVHCRKNGLPHPGVLVLDTPLLTYREPLKHPRFGALEADEIALRDSGVAEHFYSHLASLRDIGQFVVIENSDPPPSVQQLKSVHVFTGEPGIGRFGLFPEL